MNIFYILLGISYFITSHEFAAAGEAVPLEYRNLKNPLVLTQKRRTYIAKQYQTKCARCHGENGEGGVKSLEALEVAPANFTDVTFMNNRTDGQLYYQIEQGGEERSAMPAFGPDSDHGWSEKKIWEMVAYIRRLAR
ncbi:MAG: cytochrome c [SAR324 cluster bacterium]|nr:cytochrome c [SAR324 cluster bacterium]